MVKDRSFLRFEFVRNFYSPKPLLKMNTWLLIKEQLTWHALRTTSILYILSYSRIILECSCLIDQLSRSYYGLVINRFDLETIDAHVD